MFWLMRLYMSKYYYVDSENVGDEWVTLLSEADEDSHFLVFYTEKSPRMSYLNIIKLLSNNKNLEFILCYEGNNALDFQLVTYLGYQLCKEPEHEIYIVSKDTGFDSVIRFWEDRGISIHRIFSANCNNDTTTIPVSSDIELTSLSDVPSTNEKVCNEPKSEIDDLIAACPKSNTSYLHLFLVHFFGNTNGLKIYQEVTNTNYVAVTRNWDNKMCFSVLCQYIGKYTDVAGAPVTDELINFLYKHKNNPKNVLKLLQDHYGAQLGPKYKKMFKPFVKSLAKI